MSRYVFTNLLYCRLYLNFSQQTKDANIRKEKGEEEFTELTLKSRTLEIDNDKFGEKLVNQIMAQEAKEAQVLAAEAEFNRLNRR